MARHGKWLEPIGAPHGKFDTVSRPRRRHLLTLKAWGEVSNRYAWRSATSGTTEWPQSFPRRVRRSVIRDLARMFYKAAIPQGATK